jgi:peptidoglycan/LPS O-acetylase OafA/YrhL
MRATTGSPGTEARPSPRTGHLRQVDLVRVLTFGAVIAVHSVAAAFAPESVAGNALLACLHFTREGFFALSGFVLVHAARGRTMRSLSFWRRRLPPVVLPFLAWSVLYLLLHALLGTGTLPSPRQFVGVLLAGSAEYHLYFLLVTLQVYLVLPALLVLLHRTRGFHALLLAASLLVQVGVALFVQYGTPVSWIGRFYAAHAYELLVSYQFWVLLGALAAVHLEQLARVVDRFARPMLLAAVAVLAAGQVGYHVLVGRGTVPSVASSVFQPLLIPLFAATIVGLYVVGARWAATVAPAPDQPVPRLIVAASQASFGIYLVHPAVLDLLAPVLVGWPAALAAAALWASAVVVSAVFVAVVRRTPLSLALAGRPRRRPAPSAPAVPSAPSAARVSEPAAA